MKAIADRMKISYHTVDFYLRNLYARLEVQSRSAAVAKALQENLTA
jgi:two-component system, NarL family, nitrate/nitrite response regulator NarL